MSSPRLPSLSLSTRPKDEGLSLRGVHSRLSLGVLGISTIAICASSAGAQPVETLGTRALGMGGAFVAVADDASAIYWNPAGLASGAFASFVLDLGTAGNGEAGEPALDEARARRRGALVALGTPPFGLGYYRLRFDAAAAARPVGLPVVGGPVAIRDVTTLVTDHFVATVVQSLADGLHVGASFKVVRGRVGPATQPVAAGETVAETWKAAGQQVDGQARVDVDAGLMVDRGRWRVGVVGRNLAAPAFTGPTGQRVRLGRQARAGLALLPRDRLVFALDADLTTTEGLDRRRRALAAGAEYWTSPTRRLALRAGVRAHTVGDSGTAAAIGASYAVRRLTYVDAGATIGGRLADRGFSVSARILY